MPFRFRRTLKIFPGVKLNLSKGGMSVTVGPRGYHLNFGKRGVRQTIDLPGAGLSHTTYLFKGNDNDDEDKDNDKQERKPDEDNDDGIGCSPGGCLLFVVALAVGGYLVANALHWIPPNSLSLLMEEMTRWIRNVGM
jgi:hypothetical protein